MIDLTTQHEALTRNAGWVDLGARTLIELTGRDRAAFLHNFCTNEVRKLTPGSGCEAFFTSVQGKTFGHGYIFCQQESLVVDSVPDQASTLIAALDRYLIREEVQLHDRSGQWSELLLSGGNAEDVLRQLSLEKIPTERLSHTAVTVQGIAARLRRVDWTGPHDFLFQVASEQLAALEEAVTAAGAVGCSDAAFDAARIEAGTPWFGRDITAANLPQEVGRDQYAISFTKGCYLGQETVARIDALGHVNKNLCGVRFLGSDVPEPGTPLSLDEKEVGQVTSAAFSPKLGAPLALAYLRRGTQTPGTVLASPIGAAEVVKLPV